MILRSLGTRRGGAFSPPVYDDLATPPAFWLDASQEAGGGPITPADRGSLGVSVTGTVNLVDDELNGRSVLRFNGTSQRLVAGTASSFNFLHQGSEWTLVLIARTRLANPGTAQVLVDNVRTSGASVGATLFYDDRSAQARNDRLVGHIGRGVNRSYPMQLVSEDGAFPAATWNLTSVQHDQRKNARNAAHLWQAGRYQHTTFASDLDALGPHAAGNAANPLSIGSLAGAPGLYFDGDLAELRIYDRRLTTSEHAQVLDHLARKWGLAAPAYPIGQFPLQDSTTYDAFGLLTRAPSGRLVAIARSGPSHDAGVGDLKMWRNDDHGEGWPWGTTVLKSQAGKDFRNAAGGLTPTGALVAFYGVWDEASGAWESLEGMRSADEGDTWAAVTLPPVTTLAGYSPYGPLVTLPSGALLQTFYEVGGGTYKVFTLKSTDDGLSWGDRVDIHSGPGAYTETSMVRVSGVSDADSVLLAFARTNGANAPLRQFRSEDGGLTWTNMGNIPGTNFTSLNGVMGHPHLIGNRLLLLVTDRGGTGAIQMLEGTVAGVTANVSNWSAPTRLVKAYGSDTGYAFTAQLTSDPRSLAAIMYQAYKNQDPFDKSNDADLWLFGVPT